MKNKIAEMKFKAELKALKGQHAGFMAGAHVFAVVSLAALKAHDGCVKKAEAIELKYNEKVDGHVVFDEAFEDFVAEFCSSGDI